VTTEPDLFDQPCIRCSDGQHDGCHDATCGCLADHASDDDLMRGFKRMKRILHPGRELWVSGGWS
jgi:hypothetical protein